ncbi:membrane protein [Mycobacterium phage MrMiyagi]|uniref:Membrane protein n=1 Tax=Mycobacterium phage MrMiyagi TaxID=2762395 RepID=A0A7G8LPU7_9CAUD|nr:membrane protein [Mycobacterium phage MrMiyagi]
MVRRSSGSIPDYPRRAKTLPYNRNEDGMMRTRIKEILIAFVITMSIVFSLFAISQMARASADYNMGCERVRWGFLWSGYRTICDGPKRPDGSWDRTRREWTPAGYVPVSCYGYSFISCSGGYYRQESTQRLETYPVTDATVLPNEPAWLPPGTARILP